MIGIPAGVAIGHSGRGAVLVVNLANGWRAIPTLGLLVLLAVYLGFSFLTWLLPLVVLAVPVIIAGLRVGVVSGISLASVGQLIGVSSLGYLFIDGLQRSFPTEIYVGIVLVILLALICDLVLVGAGRALTPWTARG